MKPLEQRGVVDPNLNVYRTRNLMVADMSIVPKNVGINTNNIALAVEEKAAVIISYILGVQISLNKLESRSVC
jgi:alcohol oxidase